MRFEYVLGVLSIPAVLSQSKPYERGSVGSVNVNETVHSTGSDLVFSWTKCVICDGYEARLYLQNNIGTREIPYRLLSAVTAVKVRDVPPRTTFKFIVSGLPSVAMDSGVQGLTHSSDTPPAVENLTARGLTYSSVQIEWNAKSADGFVARILENNSLIQEKVIPGFNNHTVLNITDLKVETDYDIQITAFYYPPSTKSTSDASFTRAKTLPSLLPNITLRWSPRSKNELLWENPESPAPLAHRLTCVSGRRDLLDVELSGTTSSVTLLAAEDSSAIDCAMETWFSIDAGMKVSSRIRKSVRSQEIFSSCGFRYGYDRTPPSYEVKNASGVEIIVLSFDAIPAFNDRISEIDHKLCPRGQNCEASWVNLERPYELRFYQQPLLVKPWTPYTFHLRFHHWLDTWDKQRTNCTLIQALELPPSIGPVDPVTELTANTSGVSWRYNSQLVPPDYFLVTHCVGSDCLTEALPGAKRAADLGELDETSDHYVTVQALMLRDGQAYYSPAKMTLVVPGQDTSEDSTLATEKVTDPSTVG